MKKGLYIHFPHCLKKCPYCDFFSTCVKPDEDKLLQGYIRDFKQFDDIKNKTLDSVFIGGGTPSLMSENLLKNLFEAIKKHFKLKKNCEISMEINPKTIDEKKLQFLKNLGINRLSIGIQSLSDKNLEFLGRINRKDDSISLTKTAQKYFENISADFIFALPNQTKKDIEKELSEIIKLDLPHISIYQLTIAKKTPFGKIFKEGVINENDDILFDTTAKTLINAGYRHYETSNFAKKDFECLHNKIYWQGDIFFCAGPSSHGRIFKNNTWFEVSAKPDIENWLKDGLKFKKLSNLDRAKEIILMHTRLNKPFQEQTLFEKTGLKFNDVLDLREMESQHIKIKNSSFKLNKKQQKILNYLAIQIIK